MTEEKTKRRGWVKNAIIIFLVIMLVLVFFSNTIMNRSLPEVATQYTSSGTVNTMIRGTGTATANETYEVKIDQTRTVLATYVRVGDRVEPDTLLFKLRDAESDELGALRDKLEDAEYSYQLALLDAGLNDGSQTSREVERAREKLTEAQAALALLTDVTVEDMNSLKTQITELKGVEQTKKAALDKAQSALEALGGLNSGSDASGAYQAVKQAEQAKADALVAYQSVYMRYGADYEVLKAIAHKLASTQSGTSYAENAYISALTAEFGAESAAATVVPDTESVFVRCADGVHIQYPIDEASPDSNLHSKKDLAAASKQVGAALEARASAERSYENALEVYANSYDGGNAYEYNKLRKARDTAQEEYNTAAARVEEKNRLLSEYETRRSEYASAKQNVNSCSDTLEGLLLQQRQQGVSFTKTQMDLERQRADIEEMHERISEMEQGGEMTEVYANVSGVVRSISVTSGSKAPADTALAGIEIVDRGYSLTMPVTTEQASKVRVGDTAEVTTYSWGSNVTAVLTSIRNDPDKPGQGKLLLFSLSGDLESGSVLNVAIGQRSQYYDVIVPNSAIKEDSNGTYVFVIEAKNSPLGNRYFATRCNVTVVAKDDNNSAVTGSLSGWGTSVITSAPPLTSGTQVRLAENG